MRIAQYVDLANGGERVGLDAPGLWDGASDSWHGQMTSLIAAGNGLLSNSDFRGYAPMASVLLIKIGRGGGRIPEEDILNGLRWLLRADNWQKYGVRVLNVSVGGDYPQSWRENAVCLAAEELSRRGVLVVAAAGNSDRERLLAPAQAPAVLTVGGLDDHNRRWDPRSTGDVNRLNLYPHNWGAVMGDAGPIQKPELLALARWLPSPVLPVSPIFKEMHAIAALRQTLKGEDRQHLGKLLTHWQRALHLDPIYGQKHQAVEPANLVTEIGQALRKRMNAHKWVHAYYQHVDGSSVAAAQVSATAAQMMEANVNLEPAQARQLLMATALPLPHLAHERVGTGLVQPARAVAAALRAFGGILTGYPQSGTVVSQAELHKRPIQGKVSSHGIHGSQHQEPGKNSSSVSAHRNSYPVYFGYLAPRAHSVSLIGSFNGWLPGAIALERARNGWWRAVVHLPAGRHFYRFWVIDNQHPEGDWQTDPENPLRVESGFLHGHSRVDVDG
jgi:serine protease AprX